MQQSPMVILSSLEDAVAHANERKRFFGSSLVVIPWSSWTAIERLVALQTIVDEHDATRERFAREALEAEEAA